MKKIICLSLYILLICFTLYSETDRPNIGFGQQPILINPNIDNNALAKRVLGSTRYKLTPGDTYELIIQMEKTERTTLILQNDYRLEIPYIGSLDVRDMEFSDLRTAVINRIKSRLPVGFVDFVLSSPALFDVFIYGGVESPGITTVTALNRVTEVIALAKGLKRGVSYRRIQLLRGQDTILCDLTKFIRDADLSQNPPLQPRDRIYVPHPEILSQITGQITYPDTYELLPGESLADLIAMAGGIPLGGEKSSVQVSRTGPDGSLERLALSDLANAGAFMMQHGDIVRISPPAPTETVGTIFVEGALYGKPLKLNEPTAIPDRPIALTIPYRPGMTLLGVLEQFGGPTPLAEAEKSSIIKDQNEEYVIINAYRLWTSRKPELDVALDPGDHIFIPMKKLRVAVAGEVNSGGVFPYVTGWRVVDYIAAAGGVDILEGDINRVFLVDERGRRTRANLDMEVKPGMVIYVDRNIATYAGDAFRGIMTVLSVATAVISFTALIISLTH
ncbi:MAG TPA: SLBB domain-containing protein [Spirochaetia bacterium]|nr:SLBB domain-containing protein [Spirochaetia bacterium]